MSESGLGLELGVGLGLKLGLSLLPFRVDHLGSCQGFSPCITTESGDSDPSRGR
jgi:hypothetical protein